MFDKFGEFDSVEELNLAAAGQKEQGDMEALIALAMENGLDKEDAEDYMNGVTEELASPLMVAIGKINVECEDLKIKGVLLDWAQELKAECARNEGLARAVRKKGKNLGSYIAMLADAGFEHKAVVNKRIVEKCGKGLKSIVGTHEFYIGVPDRTIRKNLIKKYYQEVEG